MRNSRRLVSGLALALMMSTGLSASSGLGGATTDTCAWVAGMLYRVGAPEIIAAVFERVFGC